MVFQKKANNKGGKNQKNQIKKPMKNDLDIFDDIEDDDSDMDSDDSDDVQKTPANKTPKGKQSMSEKRVSFQVPGNKTPGKTPNKDNSAVKKPNTPGKTNLIEFQGLKKNLNAKKSSQQDEDDDDDDDEDEDDSDFDLDIEIRDDDKEEGDDDDDDDDDDDEDDDDEDDDEDDDDDDDEEDDDDDEEEQSGPKSKIQKQNMLTKQKTPMKGSEKQNIATPKSQTPKAVQTPKVAQTPKDTTTPKNIKKEKSSPKKNGAAAPFDEAERRRQRDVKQLFIGNLPKDVTEAEIKGLSPDILSCVIPKRDKIRVLYAFALFASEEKAEENFEILKEKKLRGETLNVDYVGEKSLKRKEPSEASKQYNMKKLYVSGLPITCTIFQVAKFFPKAHTIMFNQSDTFRSANVLFTSEEDCTEAFNATKEIEIGGQAVSVLHSVVNSAQLKKQQRKSSKRKPRNNMNNRQHQAKRMKFTTKKEAGDE